MSVTENSTEKRSYNMVATKERLTGAFENFKAALTELDAKYAALRLARAMDSTGMEIFGELPTGFRPNFANARDAIDSLEAYTAAIHLVKGMMGSDPLTAVVATEEIDQPTDETVQVETTEPTPKRKARN